MTIIQENDEYVVMIDTTILYRAKSLAEAEGYIAWATRSDAGDNCHACQ